MGLIAVACGGGESGGGGGAARVDEGTPQPGGRLIAAIDAESNGWHPQFASWAVAGLQVAQSIYDPLVAMDADGNLKPYLAESFTPNADHTQWTFELRPGVRFHDGEPLDARAAKVNLDGQKRSPQNSTSILLLKEVVVLDDLTFRVDLHAPWVAFPYYLSSTLGFMASPKALQDKDGASQRPVGTGPFVFKEWVPGNRFVAVKNQDYWQEGLPYLDEIEFRPIPDTQSRESSLKANTIDVLHSTDTQTIVNLRGSSAYKTFESRELEGVESEEFFYYVNTSKPPLDDVRVRRALALATDRKTIIDTVFNGIGVPANGPFSEGSKYHTDTGYPERDEAAAKRLVDEYVREKGPIRFRLGTTNVGRNLQVNQLLQAQWKRVGIETEITQLEQNAYIQNLLMGEFDVYAGRQFGAADADGEYLWWRSDTAKPVGELSLNFTRIENPKIDEQLDIARRSADESTRIEAYREVSRLLAQDLPYIWILKITWLIAGKQDVNGLAVRRLPDGSAGSPLLPFGIFDPRFAWRG